MFKRNFQLKWYRSIKNLESDQTHFGFQTVPKGHKQRLVNDVFERVASRYDVMNDVMSGGLHRLWKDAMIHALRPTQGLHYLDVAGGTGDIAFRIVEKLKSESEKNMGAGTSAVNLMSNITICDINTAMLEEGRKRAVKKGYSYMMLPNDPQTAEYIDSKQEQVLGSNRMDSNVMMQFIQGNAETLEKIPDASQDAYTIAFGIRNVPRIQEALNQAYRVLKPGGQFLCLEFSHVKNPVLKTVYDLYSFNVIPWMGQCIANDYDSYQYLVESIRKFPTQEQFAQMIEKAGFKHIRYTDLTFGVVSLHQAFKI